MMNKRRIFIGSSSEGLNLAQLVAQVIEEAGMEPILWNTVFPAGNILLEKIEQLPSMVDGAVLLATPDLVCDREGKKEKFSAPVANVVFEYGYLSARLSRQRVAICQFDGAEMPSDLQGMKVVLAGSYEKGDLLDLPAEAKTDLQSWLAALPPLAAGMTPISQVHGYSGIWHVQNRFSLWRGMKMGKNDNIYFDGKTFLVLSVDGKSGSGIQTGSLYISVSNYRAKYDIVNEVQKAEVDDEGTLTLHIKVIRRQQVEEEGDPPNERFREDLANKEFTVELKPVPGEARRLKGIHEYFRASRLYQSSEENFDYLGLIGSFGL